MHAVVVRVAIADFEKARPNLRDQIVPRAKQAPGFIQGIWTRSDDGKNGLSMMLFESRDQATAAAEQIRTAPLLAETASVENVEVREVVEQA